jgi:hypothetical protein
MYEMEGPFRPGRASEPMTRRPVRCLANHRASGTRGGTGSPALPAVPGSPLGLARFGGESSSTASQAYRTRSFASKYKILLFIHSACHAYPPRDAAELELSTASYTGR